MTLYECQPRVRVRETHVLSPHRKGTVMGPGMYGHRHIARVLWDGETMEQPVDPGHLEPIPEEPRVSTP